MKLDIYQIDAFAAGPFEGNPAAVMPLTDWLDDSVLQQLAEENNLSETAFYTARLPDDASPHDPAHPAYHLRWFTPAVEVDLCGHATLAAAAQIFEDVHPDADRIQFWTRSGWLHVDRGPDGTLVMDFPAEPPVPADADPRIVAALNIPVRTCLKATDLVFVAESEDDIASMTPDFAVISPLKVRGIVVTAASDTDGVDFVSRWFGAAAGVREDPVTGSAHSQIAPYWAGVLGRNSLVGRQLSARGGIVRCEVRGDRVHLSGTYRRYLRGTVEF
ncbi:PhzF family phenazine biosynthesis protein [Rhodococcus opacus]|uniref:Putative phenazine biosynthesis protein n=1 Tax=Rhodococcus opacus (strain B4) TaxID=632772 RepID=C1BAK5_RHOOB|nr:PhzF family phenazine biosynthesis protein [Rhodococcus opacus]BAH52708.1 putative phenazine biosynthesis protein [Rhodococcus opacus B4]